MKPPMRILKSTTPCRALASLALCGASLVFAVSASAQGNPAPDAGALYVRSLAATCANCHGTDGRPVAGSSVSGLAGLEKEFFITQMKAFKAGTRPATVMHQLSKGYSDAQIDALASYFSAQKK